MIWTLLLACQEPFDADRHDLLDFRVAAVSVAPASDGDPVQIDMAVIVDGHPWSMDPVEFRWGWIEAAEDAAGPLADPAALGPAPALVRPDDHPGWLALHAAHGTAVERVAVQVPLQGALLALGRLQLERLPWSVADVTAEELQLEARRATVGEASPRTVAPGGFSRLTIPDPSVDGSVRWMATGKGSFFETDPRTTDWAAGDLRLDDDEVEGSRETLAQGPVTVIALWLAETDPRTAFRADDLFVGPVADGVFTRGRFLPAADAPKSPWLQGRLQADPESPVGVRLVEVEALGDAPTTFSSAQWACATPVDGPFDPGWLLGQRCTVSDVDGVLAEVEVDP